MKMRIKYEISNINTKSVNLIEGVDYKIVSYSVMRNHFTFLPFGRYFGIDYKNVKTFDQAEMEALAKSTNKPFDLICLSDQAEINEQIFEILGCQHEINIDVAVDCGFGVLEVIRGPLRGDRFLYDVSGDKEDDNYEEDFKIRVAMYLLVTEPAFDSRFLERYINENEWYTDLMLAMSDGWLKKRIKGIFKNKKKGILLEFKPK